jgi:phage replication O-like protein O
MSSPQKENGYTAIANEILEQIARVKLSPTQYRIIFIVWRYTYGFNRKEHNLSLGFLSKATGCDKRQIQRELKNLEEMKVIKQNVTNGKSRIIRFNKHYDTWVVKTDIGGITIGETDNGETDNGETVKGTIGETVKGTIGETDNQEIQTKENIKDNIPHQEIIEYLNSKIGSKYKYTTKATQGYIRARWNDGFRVEDFKKVIDNKEIDWNHEPEKGKQDMRLYLRPETLFGTKFESYLNQKVEQARTRGW